MKFTKMEGLGNDYIYINCFQEQVEHPQKLAVRLSDRHFGIGADGIILIKPSEIADFCMDMYNADGSQAEMCGNGIRCVGKYVYDYSLTDQKRISVETLAGIKYLDLMVEDGRVTSVTVDMGMPVLQAVQIPVVSDQERAVDIPIVVNDCEYRMTCVSMGNPHAVVFVDNVQEFPLEAVGPLFEHHKVFPNRINTEFVEVINETEVNMRVWERGTGETLACGTGACASTVACILNHKTEDAITLHLLGGDLKVRWDRNVNKVYMTGPARVVFDGEIDEQNSTELSGTDRE